MYLLIRSNLGQFCAVLNVFAMHFSTYTYSFRHINQQDMGSNANIFAFKYVLKVFAFEIFK